MTDENRNNKRERVARGREELGRQLSGHRDRVDSYKQYYNENKGDIIDNLLINFESNKEPATAGMIVLVPILVVLYMVDWILNKVSDLPVVRLLNLTDYVFINEVLKLVFIISFGAFLATAVGRFVRTKRGFRAEKMFDEWMEKIPFLGSIYGIAKVTSDTVFNGAEEFSDPVKLEFNGLLVTAYRTGNKGEDGREVLFVPTSPNVTTGFVVEVREEDIVKTDDTARKALTRTLSAGFGDADNKKTKRRPVDEEGKPENFEEEE